MTQGWFTGLIPITVPIAGSAFGDAARAAQTSFDSGVKLAEVPYDRVVELSSTLTMPRPNFPVVNFLDAGAAPLSVLLTAELTGTNIGVYSDVATLINCPSTSSASSRGRQWRSCSPTTRSPGNRLPATWQR